MNWSMLRRAASVAGACAVFACVSVAHAYDRFVVIKAGKVITISGDEIDRGEIIIEDGRVSLVGVGLETPPGARVIEARGQTVMPGLVVARTRVGLDDYRRRGVRADLRMVDEVYLDEYDFSDMLELGVTAVAFYPDGEGVPGVASAFRTAGGDRARVLRRNAYVRATLENFQRDKRTLRDAFNKAQSELDKVEKARKDWEAEQAKKKSPSEKTNNSKDTPKDEGETPGEDKPESEGQPSRPSAAAPSEENPQSSEKSDKPAEADAFTPPEIDPTVRPLADMIEGRGTRLIVEISSAAGVLHTEDALKKHEKVKPVFFIPPSAGTDFNHVVSRLGEAKARVLTAPRISELEYTDVRYNLPGELAAAGAQVSLTPLFANRAGLERYRPRVAEIVRSGMSREDALKAMTLHPARLLGVADSIGSIEPERSADLIFLDGDPLDPLSKVVRVMIEGETVWEADDAD